MNERDTNAALRQLMQELREKVYQLEQQRVRIVSGTVAAIDTGTNTFTVTLPAGPDGNTQTVAGISSPAAFLPAVGDSIDLQVIGAAPQYQPASIAAGAITTREIAPNTVVRVFRQDAPPIADNIGDIWIDTGDGNKQYIWGPTGTIVRQNLCLNPSFEADPVGTVTAITSWTNYSAGSPGTLTYLVVNNGSGIASGTKSGKVTSSSMPATNNTAMGVRQSFTAAPGNIFNIQAVLTVAVTDANKIPEMLVEWLDGSNTVLGSQTVAGSGTVTSQQTLAFNGSALPSGTASVRLTLQRRSNGSGGSLTNADLIVDAVCVEKNRTAQAQTSYFDGSTATNGDTKWDNPAAAPGASTSTFWQESQPGTNQWYPDLLRNGGVQPGSLVASNVVASGTVTAGLLEAFLVLANVIIAGDPAGNQTRIDGTGVKVFRSDPIDGVVESGRLGFGPSDYVGGGQGTVNDLAWMIDSAGSATFSDVNTPDVTISGDSLLTRLVQASNGGGPGTESEGGLHQYGWVDGSIANITTETGLAEIAPYLDSGRMYLLMFNATWQSNMTPGSGANLHLRIRTTGNTTGPVLTSTQVCERIYTQPSTNVFQSAFGMHPYQPTNTGVQRLLLTAAPTTNAMTISINNALTWPSIFLLDLGPARALNATVNRGSSSAQAIATKQYYVELAPAGWISARGNNGTRTDTTDVVQGWDPSGFNGDGFGWWWFNIPTITGTVDRVDWYVYTNHTYYGTGGTAIWNILSSGAVASGGDVTNKLKTDQFVSGYPNVGGKTITFPSTWFSQFKDVPPTGAQAVAVSAGNAGTTNETYYCRFDGPSARLRIWYTQ